jgi:hypothetical protein
VLQYSDQPFVDDDFVNAPIEDPIAELEGLEQELQRLRWLDDPILWAKERLGIYLWSKQRDIAMAVAQFRKVLCHSCHGVGKSFDAALLACWWIDCHKLGDAFVVTTAPSTTQVEAILWRYMRHIHSLGKLPGRMNQTEWYVTVNDKEVLVAMGRKPDDYNPTAFQGIHARYVLVIPDEGSGIPDPLWEAADTLTANDGSKLFTIGNPDDPKSQFHELAKPGSGYHVVSISAFDSPNFTGELVPREIAEQLIGSLYVEERRAKWARNWYWVNANGEPCEASHGVRCVPPEGAKVEDTNPLWQSKILGVFPEHTDSGGLIQWSWILAAQQRTVPPDLPNELGQDVGGGGDASTVAQRQGYHVRIIDEQHNPDTMQTCGKLLDHLQKTGASRAKVDMIGIGRGLVDRAKEQDAPVVGINVSEKPIEKTNFDIEEGMSPAGFINQRAQDYWYLRILFEKGLIDIDEQDEDLAGELVEVRYKRNSAGKIQIESKAEAKARGVASPNRTEAVMIAYAPIVEEEIGTLTW